MKEKKEQEKIEEEKKNIEEKKEEKPLIELMQVPVSYEPAFHTPAGDFDLVSYLVWLGKEVMGMKKTLVG